MSKKEKNNLYPSLAEMIRQQGQGEDTILAHINPLEAMMLQQMGGSGTINPVTGLPQYSFLKKPLKAIRSSLGGAGGALLGNMLVPGFGAVIGGAFGQAAQNAARGKSIGAGALKGGVTGLLGPIIGGLVPGGGKHKSLGLDLNNQIMNSAPVAPPAPVIQPQDRRIGELNVPELKSEAEKLLARDQSRLAGSNYPAYTGQTTAPMSSLTQRQRELQGQFAAKDAPYAKKINSVLNRNSQGFSPQETQSLLDMLSTGQKNAYENLGLGSIQKQFGPRYGSREQTFREKGTKDLARVTNPSRGNLEHLSNTIRGHENTYNQGLADTLKGLQGVKQNKREELLGLLGELGNQKHTYGNFVNDNNKAEFNRQVNEPYKKMDLLKKLLQSQGDSEGVDSSVEAANHRALQQGLRAYGIDTSKPVGEWEKSRIETPKYRGQLTANLPSEIMQSYNSAQQLSPKWRESTFDERKRLEKEAMNKKPLGTRAIANLPENMRPYEENLDWATKKLIKKEIKGSEAQHIGRGTYGSGAHISETEKKIRELLRGRYGERENLLQGVVGRNVSSNVENDVNELRKLVQLGQLSKGEFANIIKNNRDLNQLGASKWNNEQNRLGNEYQDFQNELSWEWPNLRQKNANLNMLKPRYDLSLNALKGQPNSRFNELEKENRLRLY